MKDSKTLFLIVLAMGALVAIWYFGWFGQVIDTFRQIKKYTIHR